MPPDRPESPPLDRLLRLLQGVRQRGSRWSARCPGHDDSTPSLSIAVGRDGRVLLKCHAGCALADILAPLGLQPGDLFAEARRTASGTAPSPPTTTRTRRAGCSSRSSALSRRRSASASPTAAAAGPGAWGTPAASSTTCPSWPPRRPSARPSSSRGRRTATTSGESACWR